LPRAARFGSVQFSNSTVKGLVTISHARQAASLLWDLHRLLIEALKIRCWRKLSPRAASFRPVLRTSWPSAGLSATSSDAEPQQAGGAAGADPARGRLAGTDSVLPATDQFRCLYSPANSSELRRPPLKTVSVPTVLSRPGRAANG
jgi:hypothetical protein